MYNSYLHNCYPLIHTDTHTHAHTHTHMHTHTHSFHIFYTLTTVTSYLQLIVLNDIYFVSKTDTDSGEICCWENIVGQEMYKLSWTQMGAEILSIFFIDGAVWIVALWGPQKIKKYVCTLY